MSGFRGLNLFSTTSSGFGLLDSGGGRSGSVVSILGAGPLGVGPSGAGGSGAGVADTGFGLNPLAVTDLMKQNQLYHYTSRKEQNVHYAKRCKLKAKTSS
jgi:hypothetical protein